jgi:hypothetical protein
MPSHRHSVTLTLTEATYYSSPLRDTSLLSHSLRPHITDAFSETQHYSHTHWGHILLTLSQRHSITLNTHWGHITHAFSETQCYSYTHWGHILLMPSQRHSVTLTLTQATYYSCPLRDPALLSHSLRPHITHAFSETQCYSHNHWGHILLMPSQRHSITLTLTEATYYSCPLRDTALLLHSLRPHITHALLETQCYSHTHWGHILFMLSLTAQALSPTTHTGMSSGECTYIFCGLTCVNGWEEKNLDNFEKWIGMWKAEYV